MTLDKEEEIIVLYALHACGGKGSKKRILYYIHENMLCKPRDGDGEIRSANETKLDNDLAWAAKNLKGQGHVTAPAHGIWAISPLGKDRLFRVAEKAATYPEEKLLAAPCERLSEPFLGRLRKLGGESVSADNELRLTPQPGS